MIDNALPTGYIYSHADSNRRAELVAAYLANTYRPHRDVEMWPEMAEFARERIAMTKPYDVADARDRMGILVRYLAWVIRSTGKPAGPGLLTSRLIERYLLTIQKGTSSGQLGKIRQTLILSSLEPLDDLASARELDALTVHSADPLSWPEIVEAFNWAQTLDGDHRRRAETWIALGAGCGIMTAEMETILRGDVLVDDSGLSVRVHGRRPRTVPVLQPFARTLRRLSEGEPTEPLARFVVGQPSETGKAKSPYRAMSRTRAKGAPPHLNIFRLRAFWFEQQFQQMPNLAAFIAAAGIRPGAILNDWGHLAPTSSEAAQIQMLRNPGAKL